MSKNKKMRNKCLGGGDGGQTDTHMYMYRTAGNKRKEAYIMAAVAAIIIGKKGGSGLGGREKS